jgi:hypothetical protein
MERRAVGGSAGVRGMDDVQFTHEVLLNCYRMPPRFRVAEATMRLFRASILAVVVLVCVPVGLDERGGSFRGISAWQTIFSTQAATFGQQGPPVRVPDTVGSQPGSWPQQGTKRTVDVTELKKQANEVVTLSQALPVQIEQIGNGKLPKELIENLKKIEKLSKHIRSEIE